MRFALLGLLMAGVASAAPSAATVGQPATCGALVAQLTRLGVVNVRSDLPGSWIFHSDGLGRGVSVARMVSGRAAAVGSVNCAAPLGPQLARWDWTPAPPPAPRTARGQGPTRCADLVGLVNDYYDVPQAEVMPAGPPDRPALIAYYPASRGTGVAHRRLACLTIATQYAPYHEADEVNFVYRQWSDPFQPFSGRPSDDLKPRTPRTPERK